ncbi:MAG: hypothetical protein R3222_03000 [Balneolaceae bacterium]|nr:hypothetical protein [Balneolaceae bacterium]
MLSLLVAVSPVLCSAQATDSLNYPEGHLKVENDSRSESAPITATPPSIQNSSSESVTLSKSKKQFIPVLSFTVASLTVKEDVGAVNLRVELLEAGDTGVEVDVVFV